MIPFGALTLNPAVAIFGQPIMVTPTSSQPGVAPYAARAVYRLRPVEQQIEGTDLFHQTFQHELGIKLSMFAVPPVQGDAVAQPAGTLPADGLLPSGTFLITNVIIDDQGGATLILRKTA